MKSMIKTSGMIATLALFTFLFGSWRFVRAEASIETVRTSSNQIDTSLHELAHAVSQVRESSVGAGATAASRMKNRSRTGIMTADEIGKLTDKILLQTLKLKGIYTDQKLEEGIGYMNNIEIEVRKIKDLSQTLSSVPGTTETDQFYNKISERLRHINRAKSEHDK